MARKAVVLFNLGGPDQLASVEPFLFNLFNDPAIIQLPKPIRFLVAKLISKRRGPVAREIYKNLGGKSPLLEQTDAQAGALATVLSGLSDEYKIFVCMRYWHPRASETVLEVKNFDPDEVILLPLYPQFSTTTTASSVTEWKKVAKNADLDVKTTALCCYPNEKGFSAAYADLILKALANVEGVVPKLLFSAHGLPKKIVDRGDPYPWQIEQSVNGILQELGRPDLDHQICYQSRVGPVEWIGPSTEDEIRLAGSAGQPIMVIPVAFVSEHSETLVELDLEYAEIAQESGVPGYYRVPTVTLHPKFIEGLGNLVKNRHDGGIKSACGAKICPSSAKGCAQFSTTV
ncbi:MAG: ferrochelatase, partial [Sneathiella sp.]|nr:ferrochelatase [Sneathiella sp.]